MLKMTLAILVGRAILPAAAFQAACSDWAQIFIHPDGRLKAGRSQDWLPHFGHAKGWTGF
jgi:hypothetical protein